MKEVKVSSPSLFLHPSPLTERGEGMTWQSAERGWSLSIPFLFSPPLFFTFFSFFSFPHMRLLLPLLLLSLLLLLSSSFSSASKYGEKPTPKFVDAESVEEAEAEVVVLPDPNLDDPFIQSGNIY